MRKLLAIVLLILIVIRAWPWTGSDPTVAIIYPDATSVQIGWKKGCYGWDGKLIFANWHIFLIT